MATFKTRKKFVPGKANAAPLEAQKAKLAEDLGLSEDEEEDAPVVNENGGADDNSNGNSDDEGEGGISFVEFVSLQKALRRVTEQKRDLQDQLKAVSERLKKTDYNLNRATQTNKMQIGITMKAQKTQLDELNGIIDSLKLAVEEMEEAANGGQQQTKGIRQLVDQLKTMSAARRELEESSQLNQGLYNQAKEDLEQSEILSEDTINGLRQELDVLRGKIDPVAADDAMTKALAAGGMVNTKQIKALQNEIASMKDKLEIAEAQKEAAAVNSSSSEQLVRVEAELKEKNAKIAEITQEMNNMRAGLAKAESMSASGTAASDEAKAKTSELNAQIADFNNKNRELQNQIEKIQEQLKQEQEAHARAKGEVENIRNNLGAEMAKFQNAAASGEDSAKQLEADLTAERVNLTAEKSAHEATKQDLETARAEAAALKDSLSGSSASFENEMREARERHATMLQNAKADGAAELAEQRQRHDDDMKDLRSKLGSFASIVAPMAASYKELATNYRALRTESRELAATIAPAIKQCKRDLLKTLAEVDKQYKEMLTKYRKEMALRKKLHNELVDLKGNIRVFCRLRPKISEDGDGPQSEFAITQNKADDQIADVMSKGKKTSFDMDVVFPPTSTQQQVFEAASDLIHSVIDGYNVCIFAYGQTGSGKTFTMEGSDAHPGLNRRALKSLFDLCEEKKADWSYEFEVSVMEIYNETLRDLLNTDKKAKENKLEIKHGKSGPHVPGVIKRTVRTVDEVNENFASAKKIRSTATTDMNEHSSRSHCLLIVYVTGTNLSTGVQTTGKLNLIDLAGSERVGKSGALDDEKRLREATNINKSLSSLGDVIHALGAKQKHIPFRNSKLTHLLQDSLGGSAKTLMLVQISPVIKNVSESLCSLNFASRVRKVELGSAKKTSESAEMSALRKRIKELESSH